MQEKITAIHVEKTSAKEKNHLGLLVGNSSSMRQIHALIKQIAPSAVSVLITGESGTGKEIVARTIHELSHRKKNQFIAINCAAIPETLMESELFGYEKNAFTGAASRKLGCFEMADGGTLLLDEIAEMPHLLQAKLLRALEQRTIRRLGGSKEIPIDVRVIAATNQNPHEAVSKGRFREDLLYRLNVFTIELPPLRERKEDLPMLCQQLIKQLSERHERPATDICETALELLQAHNFPGNVRELRNILERAVIVCPDEKIERQHIAITIDQRQHKRPSNENVSVPLGMPIDEVERLLIMRTLQKTENNKTRAAEMLGISLKTLHNKLNAYRERGLLNEQGEFLTPFEVREFKF
jgi:transcriptional regulator with PAS, ATPase and Fis domain